MEKAIAWAYRPPVYVCERLDVVPANESAHYFPPDAVGFAVLPAAVDREPRNRRVFYLPQGYRGGYEHPPANAVYVASIQPNVQSVPYRTLVSRIVFFFRTLFGGI